MATKEQLLEQLDNLQRKALTMHTIETVDGSTYKLDDYRDQIEEAKPSEKPDYWAKKGCKECHGTGVAGTMTQNIGNTTNKMTTSQICSCATKKWHKWQEEFVAQLKHQKAAEPQQLSLETNTTTPPKAKTETSAAPKMIAAMGQIERLSDRVATMQGAISKLQARSEALPQRAVVCGAEASLLAAQDAWATQKAEVRRLEGVVAQYDAEAEELRILAKRAAGMAAAARQSLKSDAKPAITVAAERVRQAGSEVDLAKKQLTQADHQVQKKIREIEKKVDKLRARILRVERENDLYSSVFTSKEVDSFADQDTPANG
jgi:hypothetical protein